MSHTAIDNRARHALGFLKTTLVGGLVFLVPAIALLVVVGKALAILRKLARPLTEHLPIHTVFGVLAADVIVIALLVVLCFFGGLLARVSFARRLVGKAETGMLWRIPGYGLLKGLTDSFDKRTGTSSMHPVLVHSGGQSQLAFEVEQLDDGRRVIYVPSSPDPRAGSVLIVDPDRIEPVPMSFVSAITSLRALGRGMGSSLSHSAR
jgi:uncharacterized membrane protein